MLPRNRRVIQTGHLLENMIRIRRAVPANVRIMAVVKADGYGHGAVEASKAALDGGADCLAVASVAEGAVHVGTRHIGLFLAVFVFLLKGTVYGGELALALFFVLVVIYGLVIEHPMLFLPHEIIEKSHFDNL